MIPEDVSGVGFDNINESLILTPELTTVHVEKQQMAQWAVDLLTSPFHTSSAVSAKIKIDTRLLVGKSITNFGLTGSWSTISGKSTTKSAITSQMRGNVLNEVDKFPLNLVAAGFSAN